MLSPSIRRRSAYDRRDAASVVRQRCRTSNLSSDPLRRFRATCLRSDILLMGRHLRVETDSAVVLRRIKETFRVAEAAPGPPQFVWRIVSEPREESGSTWPSKSA